MYKQLVGLIFLLLRVQRELKKEAYNTVVEEYTARGASTGLLTGGPTKAMSALIYVGLCLYIMYSSF